MKHSVVFVMMLLIFLSLPAYPGENIWSSNGPFGGDARHFFFHPTNKNTIFSTVGSSLYGSFNAGRTWEVLLQDRFTFASPAAIHPKNPDLILAAPNRILFKSTDRGKTWQQHPSTAFFPPPTRILDLKFHPKNPDTLYALTWKVNTITASVFRSTDGGLTWKEKNKGLPNIRSGSPKLVVDQVDGNILYVLLPSSPDIYRSANGGDSWQFVGKGLNIRNTRTIALDPRNAKILYLGDVEGIFKTTNGGATWAQVCDCGSFSISIDHRNPKNIFSAGNFMHRSIDGGATWQKLLTPFPLSGGAAEVAVHPLDNRLVFAGGQNIGVFRSVNFGNTWSPVNRRISDLSNIERISVSRQQPKTLFATASTIAYRSQNSGKTWNFIKFPSEFFPAFPFDLQVNPVDPKFVVAAGNFGSFSAVLSTDAGNTWRPSELPGNRIGQSLAFDQADRNTFYLSFISTEGIVKTTNGGKTWHFINTGLTDRAVSTIVVDGNTPSNLFAGTKNGRIFKSVNRGKNWTNTSSGIPTGRALTSIVIDPADSASIYAAAGFQIYKSTDAGKQWKLKQQPFINVLRIAIRENPAIVYAVGPGLIIASVDGGENWGPFDSRGLSGFTVNDFATVDNQFFAAGESSVFSYTIVSEAGGPIIDQILPVAARIGDTIEIHGRNFGSEQRNSILSFSEANATAESWTDTNIRVQVPAGARTGRFRLTVESRKSNSVEFVLLPNSGQIEPSSGPSSGGTSVAVLVPPNSATSNFNILFGSTIAKDLRLIANNLFLCTSPPGAGIVKVSLATSAVNVDIGQFSYE